MANVKISALPAVASALSTDIFPVVQAGVTKKETLLQVATLLGFSTGILGISAGGTGVSSVTAAPAASAWAGWDANKNLSANSFISGYTTTATAAGTTTLTVASTNLQYFTGVTTQTVVLPVTSTLVLGQSFYIVNNSTGVVTVNSSGGNLVTSMVAGSSLLVVCILTSGTDASSWSAINSAIALPLAIADGGTGVTSVTLTPTATSFAGWNANRVMRANSFCNGYTTTATSGGTTTMTSSSNYWQYFTGTLSHTVKLAVASTLITAQSLCIVNNSSGTITIQSSGLNTVTTLAAGNYAVVVCILTSGTDASSWSVFTAPVALIATPVSLANGGTNAALTAVAGGIAYSGASAIALSAAGSSGQLFQSAGTSAPGWTTSTYPVTNAVSTLLYASSANVMAALATANNGTLVTSNSGVPSILAGPGVTGNIFLSNAAAAPSWSTSTYPTTNAINTLLYASSSNVMSALATANNGTLITSSGGVPSISSTLPNAVQDNITRLGTIANIAASLGVAFGGTGAATFTAYSVICAGTTSTGAFQNVSGVGTSGQILTSAGASALPTWSKNAAITTVNLVSITSTQTYTPSSGLVVALIEVAGAGGGAGAITGGTAGQAAFSSGGGGGGYSMKIYTAAGIGANATVTIGAAGTGGTGAGTGGTGGATTFSPAGAGGTITGNGGTGGLGMSESALLQIISGGNGGTGTGGTINVTGGDGEPSMSMAAATGIFGGGGGSSFLSNKSYNLGATSGSGTGGTRIGPGQGASGRYSIGTGGSTGDGQPGNAGICNIIEFIS